MKIRKRQTKETKVKKYAHLTERPNGQFVLSTSVPPGEAEPVSAAITRIMASLRVSKAEAIRQGILWFWPGMDTLEHIALLLNSACDLPSDTPGLDDAIKALASCQADMTLASWNTTEEKIETILQDAKNDTLLCTDDVDA